MALFKPSYPQGNALVGSTGAAPQMPEVTLPQVGDTMQVVAHPYGGFSVVDNDNGFYNGAKVMTVEVKEIQTAKTVLE